MKIPKLNAHQLKKIDDLAQARFAIPGIILMENAGLHAAELALKILKKNKIKNVKIFCGPGNNGGDGYVVGRHLLNNGISVTIFLLGPLDKIKGDALTNFIILRKMGIKPVAIHAGKDINQLSRVLKTRGLIIDAIFGIGLSKEIVGIFKQAIECINSSKNPVLSLDTPSGLCATTGKIFGVSVKADHTVSFAALKKGFFLKCGPRQAGKVTVVDIGIPRSLLR